MDNHLLEITGRYIDEPIKDIRPLGNGHINESLLVSTDSGFYVLQRLSDDLFGAHLPALEDNYLQYRFACERSVVYPKAWICPEWLKTKSGRFFHKDAGEKIWRLYRYIPGDGEDSVKPYAAGIGLGKMHKILSLCDRAKITSILPGLHDLTYYYRKYLTVGESLERNPELDKAISENIDKMLDIRVPSDAVIHGDAKISNMIMRDGDVIGFIDLDTLMQGSVYDDLADCIRSCCMADNGKIDMVKADELLDGYEVSAEVMLSLRSRSLVTENVKKNLFMLGLRYYTDHLTGNRYFTEAYPGRNLEKAEKLLLSL